MLLTSSKTAIRLGLAALLAVFFSSHQVMAQDQNSLSGLEADLNDLILSLSRSVVTVNASRQSVPETGPTMTTLNSQSVISSGIIYDSAGHIVVSAPMVVGFDRLLVQYEGHTFEAALVAVDYFNEIALLNTDTSIGQPINVSTNQTCAASMVIGLGNGYGIGSTPALGFCAGTRPDGLLQFTFPVSSGHIGGGVFNLSGELVGVISGTIGSPDRYAVALAAHRIPSLVSYLLTFGDRQAGYIGINTADIELSAANNISNTGVLAAGGVVSSGHGVLLQAVQPQSPAHRAGFRAGDILLFVNKDRIGSSRELATFIKLTQPGTRLDISVLRHNSQIVLPVQVGSRPLWPLQRTVATSFDPSAGALSPDSLSRVLNYLMQQMHDLEIRYQTIR